MKKYLFTLLIFLTSLCAYPQNFAPSCSGNDGISYIQGETWVSSNGTPCIKLDGYGKYNNATAVVIVYTKGYDHVEREWYRKTVKITNGTSGTVYLTSLKNVTRVDVKVANFCN